MLVYSCHLLLDHIQFTLIYRTNIPGSYEILFFIAQNFSLITDTSTTEHCFCFGPATSFFLELLVIALYSSLVAYWTPSELGTHLPVSYLFAFSYFFAYSCIIEARILEWFAIPFSSGPHFVRILHYHPSFLGGPTQHGSSFHWVRQGCGPCDQFG